MCESNAFIVKGGKKERVMKDVIRVDVDGDIKLYSILGDSKTLQGFSLDSIDLLKHEILFRCRKT